MARRPPTSPSVSKEMGGVDNATDGISFTIIPDCFNFYLFLFLREKNFAMTYLKIGMTYRVGFYFMTSALMEASVSPLCERVRI